MPPDDATFVKAYLTNGGNQLRAAQEAWPHLRHGSAAHAGVIAFRRLHDIVTIHMDQRGLTLDRLLTMILDGLTATQGIVVQDSKDTQHIEYVPDNRIRVKFTEMALKLRGELIKQPEVVVLAPPVPEVSNTTNNLNVSLTPDVLVAFEDTVMAKIHQQLLNNSSQQVDLEEGDVV